MSVHDRDRIGHMLDMAHKIHSLIYGLGKDEVRKDETLLMALSYALVIIGEAAANVSDDFQEKHDFVSWKRIIGMRNWLVHGYFKTDIDVIWDTITGDIPLLIKQLEKITEIQP